MTAGPDATINRALAPWGIEGAVVEGTPRDHHGLSGVRVWRIRSGEERFALRQLGVSSEVAEQAIGAHRLMRHAARVLDFVPSPRSAGDGQTVALHEGCYWSLESWMHGEPANTPSREQVELAATALWRLHEVTHDSQCFGPFAEEGACRAMQRRLEVLKEWSEKGAAQWQRKSDPRPLGSDKECFLWSLPHGRGAEVSNSIDQNSERGQQTQQQIDRLLHMLPVAAPRALPLVAEAAEVRARRQPIVGDVRRDHVLFSTVDPAGGERVTGLIDYGAATVDSPLVDLARLLGELAGNDVDLWSAGLAAYQRCRRLGDRERRLIAALDAGGVVGASINWLGWLAAGNVPRNHSVAVRLGELADRLEAISAGNLTAQRALLGGAA